MCACVCVCVREREREREKRERSRERVRSGAFWFCSHSKAQVPLNFNKWLGGFLSIIQPEEEQSKDKERKDKGSTSALYCSKIKVTQMTLLEFVWRELLMWHHLDARELEHVI